MAADRSAVGAARTRGVTMLELLVVLMLIGVVSAMVMPRVFSGPSQAELRSSARQVAAGLRLARSKAVTEHRQAFLEVDLEKRTFRVDAETPRPLPAGVEVGLFTAQRDVVDAKVGGIRFYPDGGSNGGRIALATGGRRFNIDVDWLTGRVSIVD